MEEQLRIMNQRLDAFIRSEIEFYKKQEAQYEAQYKAQDKRHEETMEKLRTVRAQSHRMSELLNLPAPADSKSTSELGTDAAMEEHLKFVNQKPDVIGYEVTNDALELFDENLKNEKPQVVYQQPQVDDSRSAEEGNNLTICKNQVSSMDEFSNSLEQRHKSLEEKIQQQAPGAPGNTNLYRNLNCDFKLEFTNFEVSTTIAPEMFDEIPKKGKLEVVVGCELKDKIGEKLDEPVQLCSERYLVLCKIPDEQGKVLDFVHDTYKLDLEGSDLVYDSRVVSSFGAFPRVKLKFNVLFEDIALIRSTGNCSPDHTNEKGLTCFTIDFLIASASSLFFVYSLDYARTRLANDAQAAKKGGERQFNGLVDVYKKTLKSDGVAGFYRGFNISCVGIMVYRGLYFEMYDSLKPVPFTGKLQVSFFASLAPGWVLTNGAGLASYSLDTVCRRMMMTFGAVFGKWKGLTENVASVQISAVRASSNNLTMVDTDAEHLLEEVVAKVCQNVSDIKCEKSNLRSAVLEPCIGDNRIIGSSNYSYHQFSIVEDFEKYVQLVVQMMHGDAEVCAKLDDTDEEMMEYANQQRRGIFEAYSGILQGFKTTKADLLLFQAANMLQFIQLVSNGKPRDESVITAAVALLGNLADALGPKLKMLFQEHSIWIEDLVREFLREHNVGTSTCLNFSIQKHKLLLVESEESYGENLLPIQFLTALKNFVIALNCCNPMATVEQGKQLHARQRKIDLVFDPGGADLDYVLTSSFNYLLSLCFLFHGGIMHNIFSLGDKTVSRGEYCYRHESATAIHTYIADDTG